MVKQHLRIHHVIVNIDLHWVTQLGTMHIAIGEFGFDRPSSMSAHVPGTHSWVESGVTG